GGTGGGGAATRAASAGEGRVGAPRLRAGLVVRRGAAAAPPDPRHDRLLRALVETLAPPLDRAEELVQVDLEGREDAVRPVLHLEARLARLAPGLVDDLLRLAFGELDDLRLRGLANGLLARLPEGPVAFPLRLRAPLLPFLDDPAGLLDLFGDRRTHLVEDVVDLLAVDADLVGQRDGLRVVDEVVELVDENEYVHEFTEFTEDASSVALAEQAAEKAGRRLRFGLGVALWRLERGQLAPLVRAEHPAGPPRAQALEQTPRLFGGKVDVAGRIELLGERRGGIGLTAGLQLLSELARIRARERHAVALTAGEEALESLGL